MGRIYKYGVGDLVICKYEFEYLYYPTSFGGPIPRLFFIGIIVARKEQEVIFFDRHVVYDVLCVDGIRRYFATWEIEVLRRA